MRLRCQLRVVLLAHQRRPRVDNRRSEFLLHVAHGTPAKEGGALGVFGADVGIDPGKIKRGGLFGLLQMLLPSAGGRNLGLNCGQCRGQVRLPGRLLAPAGRVKPARGVEAGRVCLPLTTPVGQCADAAVERVQQTQDVGVRLRVFLQQRRLARCSVRHCGTGAGGQDLRVRMLCRAAVTRLLGGVALAAGNARGAFLLVEFPGTRAHAGQRQGEPGSAILLNRRFRREGQAVPRCTQAFQFLFQARCSIARNGELLRMSCQQRALRSHCRYIVLERAAAARNFSAQLPQHVLQCGVLVTIRMLGAAAYGARRAVVQGGAQVDNAVGACQFCDFERTLGLLQCRLQGRRLRLCFCHRCRGVGMGRRMRGCLRARLVEARLRCQDACPLFFRAYQRIAPQFQCFALVAQALAVEGGQRANGLLAHRFQVRQGARARR